MPRRPSRLTPEDLAALERAYVALEHPSFAARMGSVLGAPVQQGIRLLPYTWQMRVQATVEGAIAKALAVAVDSLRHERPKNRQDALHRMLAMGTGAAGGFFGLPALLIELPFTTVIMLRAIADVANDHHEDLDSLEARLACMEVFAVGGRSHGADYAEIGYYEVRAALSLHFATFTGAIPTAMPRSVELVRAIAARFGLVVSDKVALQSTPILGAAAGAAINALFVRHFQDVAEGHFTVRALERRYGRATVEAAYAKIAAAEAAAARPYALTYSGPTGA
jgi:hypothetical protein